MIILSKSSENVAMAVKDLTAGASVRRVSIKASNGATDISFNKEAGVEIEQEGYNLVIRASWGVHKLPPAEFSVSVGINTIKSIEVDFVRNGQIERDIVAFEEIY
ncbi:MAG: hypothetical protein QXU18_08710 [Thermoplasmatales archaeon]